MGKLVDHARREMLITGEDPITFEGVLNVVQAFEDMNHSGASRILVASMINELLQFKNLAPLTDNPNEWTFFDKTDYGWNIDVWQNKRNAKAFSDDAGQTYWLVSEPRRWWGGRRLFKTVRSK